MKLPEEVRALLARRFQNKHRDWLGGNLDATQWPLEINLEVPTEPAALRHLEGVRAWVGAWQSWRGVGRLRWSERRWRVVGVQRLPEALVLDTPAEVAQWLGETSRWLQANVRYRLLTERWPCLGSRLPRFFDVLADYSHADFERLEQMLSWIISHPQSNLYPRQLPIPGLDSKWIESRKGLITDLVTALQGGEGGSSDFFLRCGLRAPPDLIRLRVLDPELRRHMGGLGDLMAPLPDLAALALPAPRVLVVENLQTGLALPDFPGVVAFMGLGYHVELLSRIPWIGRSLYWGDLDTHGFAILNRARTHVPNLQSVLMDEKTLLLHRELWGEEKEQHSSHELPWLTEAEQSVYRALKGQQWGQNIRLEQERVSWAHAMEEVGKSLGVRELKS